MKKRIQPVVIAVIRKNNQYLLTKRSKLDIEDKPDFLDKWEIAGGGMEFGEKPEEALHREVKEELGIEVLIIGGPVLWTEVRGNWQGLFLCYLCQMKKEDAAITLNEESSDYRWATKDEIINLPTLPGVKEMVESFSKSK